MTAAAREALLLGALSAVVLALEVFDTRLVAYAVPLVLVYAVLGIALLGFGAAGSLVATRPEWRADERRPAVLAAAALVFAATIVLGHALFVRVAPFLHGPSLTALLLSGLLALPYLAAGVVVTVALSAAGPRLGLTYAADLVGSGLGCFVPIVLLGPLVGEGLLALLAAAAC
ncbi:MAG: hypothetical protein FJ104_15065, partial [Deltaproteobacteria bacterium]|nr:hypothetical protein [Deltaproteobacteria bacterium]